MELWLERTGWPYCSDEVKQYELFQHARLSICYTWRGVAWRVKTIVHARGALH